MADKKSKLLILDLDETLVHATQNKLEIREDFLFDKFYIYKRPYLQEFFTSISKDFNVGIWSSASDDYVNEIARLINPDHIDFEIVWGNSKCSLKRDLTFDTYHFEKRLDKLKKKGFKLEEILIVDDTKEKARANYGNAIYIKAFSGDPNDHELNHLSEYLANFRDVENVRIIEKRNWRK